MRRHACAGYRIAGEAEMNGLALRPYAAIAYEREFDDDPVAVTAGSNALAGRFTAAGFMPRRHWLSADVGIWASLAVQDFRLPQQIHDLLRLVTLPCHRRHSSFHNPRVDQLDGGGSMRARTPSER